MLKSIVTAEVVRGDGTLLDVTFLKDFGPWKVDQLIAQLRWEDDWLIELNINGEEVRRVQVTLMPVITNICVHGRHRAEHRGQPEFVATYDNGVVRVDDKAHPDFWLEVRLV